MSIAEGDIEVIESLLGREPRGLEDVAVRDNAGVPMVVRVAPLVNKKPFPTLFWLIDKRVNYAIDQVEAAGLIAQFQARVDASTSLQAKIEEDHLAHIRLRRSFMSDADVEQIQALGFDEVFASRGIGGIADFQRIRCLHTYYASHLVSANTIGLMLEAYWAEVGLRFPHIEVS
jgi:hypothetical protein